MCKEFFQSINTRLEEFFYSLGGKITKFPRLILAICLILLSVFSCFILLSTDVTSLSKLWLESDSHWYVEDAFVTKHFNHVNSRSLMLLVTKKNAQGGDNIITPDLLSELHDITTSMYDKNDLSISHNGETYGFLDLCRRFPLPEAIGTILGPQIEEMGGVPCLIVTPLDCFAEGVFTVPPQVMQLLPSFGFPNKYNSLISYEDKSKSELFNQINEGCTVWQGTSLPQDVLFGGIGRSPAGNISSIVGMETILDVSTPWQVAKKKGITEKEAEELILKFEKGWLDQMEKEAEKSKNFDIAYFATERSTKDLVEEASAANGGLIAGGYLSMLVFAALTQLRMPRSSKYDISAIVVGVVGVLLVMLSVGATLGFLALVGLAYTPSIKQVLPFLALGLGVDDMFVISSSFVYDPKKTVEEMCASGLAIAGASISLTSLTNTIAFAIGASVPLPAVSSLSLAACVAVIVNYLVILFGFSSVLVIWAKRLKEKTGNSDVQEKAIEETTTEPTRCQNFLTNPLCIVIQFLLSGAIFGIAIYGASLVEVGLPLEDIVPTTSYAAPFLRQRIDYYNSYPCVLICGMGYDGNEKSLDYEKQLDELINLTLALGSLPFSDDEFTIPKSSWLHILTFYANEKTPQWLNLNKTLQDQDGIFQIDGSHFYDALDHFLGQRLEGPYYGERLIRDENGKIIASGTRIGAKGLIKTQDFLDWIDSSRAVVEASNLPCFMSGFVYKNYEQYIHVNEYLIKDLIYVGVAIFFASFFFLYHPLAVIILLIVNAKSVFEIYGFLHFFGLKINGVCVVNLIVASGVIIEFTAHLIRAFMIATGNNAERVQKAIEEMGAPVLMGGISTFLGVAWTGLSTFPYFRIYYFYNFVLIVFIGLFNAFFFLLPVLCIAPLPSLSAAKVNDDAEGDLKMTETKV